MDTLEEKLLTLTEYNCEVCHGENITVTEYGVTHLCTGELIPCYEVVDQ